MFRLIAIVGLSTFIPHIVAQECVSLELVGKSCSNLPDVNGKFCCCAVNDEATGCEVACDSKTNKIVEQFCGNGLI